MKEESKQFIINLANEMQKQDTRCTAQPYGLVIRNKHRFYGIKKDYAQFCGYYDKEDCENYYHEENFDDFIKDISYQMTKEDLIKLYEKKEKHNIKSFYDLDLYCSDIIPDRYELQGYNEDMTADSSNGFYEGNFFLTEKAANKFIDRNKHNLNQPDTYGIHLYRNPEMEQLFEVIFELAKELKGESYE